MAVPRDAGGGAGRGVGSGVGLTLAGWVAIAVALVLLGSRWPTLAYGTLWVALLFLLMSRADEVVAWGEQLIAGAASVTS